MHKAAYNSKHGDELKILTPKQMLQRLPIALEQAKVGDASENLLNEICQLIYSWYREKESTQLLRAMKNLNYLMDHNLYQAFNIILSILSKNLKKLLIILQ